MRDSPATCEPQDHHRWGIVEELRVIATAIAFLTRVPAARHIEYRPERLARSTVWFPLVGVLVGAFGAATLAVAHFFWTPFTAVVLSTMTTVYVTGAFHEDAVADACDGFGGGWERAQVLAIMKDSRVGSYGVVGLVLLLLVKIAALTQIAAHDWWRAGRALLVAHVLGRWSSLPLIYWLPYVRDDGGKSRPFAASVTTLRLVGGTLLTVLVIAAFLEKFGSRDMMLVFGAAVVTTGVAGRYFRKRLDGMTGDCLGAANQAVEAVVYLVLAANIGVA